MDILLNATQDVINNQNGLFKTCHHKDCLTSLETMIMFLNKSLSEECNMINALYEKSYLESDGLFYKGYRDYYMKLIGFTQLVTDIGMISYSVYYDGHNGGQNPDLWMNLTAKYQESFNTALT